MQTPTSKTIASYRPTIVLLFLVAAASLAATTTGGLDCPDRGVKIVPSKARFGPPQNCSSDIIITGGPLTVGGGKSQCPTFVIYEPTYHFPTDKKGFEAVPGRLEPITIFTYRCATRWLWGWIPIPVGASCRPDQTRSGGTIQNYVEHACNSRGRGVNGGRGTTGR